MKPFQLIAAFAVLTAVLTVDGAEPDAKTQRYLDILAKRPAPGYLFERFYNAWLANNTAGELESYLGTLAGKKPGPNHQLLLAFFYEHQGNDTRAIEQYEKALRDHPAAPEILYHKAMLENRCLRTARAIEHLEEALKGDCPDALRVKMLKLLGQVQVRSGDREKGLATWTALTGRYSDDRELREELIDLKRREGLMESAAADCKALIASTRTEYERAMLTLQLGDIHQHAGEKQKAVDAYTSVLDKAEGGSWLEKEVLSQIEHVYRLEHDTAGLREQYDKLAAQHAKRVYLLKRRAFILREQGDVDGAVAAFKGIVKVSPGDRTTREEYVRLLLKCDKAAEAVAEASALCDEYPDDGELLLSLAAIQHQAEQTDGSRETLLKYLERSQKTEFDYLRVARLLNSHDHTNSATTVYDRLVEAFPGSVASREARASHLYVIGRTNEARRVFTEIAADAGCDDVMRIARQLGVRHDHRTAYDILTARGTAFSDSFPYQVLLVDEARALDMKDEAVAHARKLLGLATRFTEIETAVGAVASAARAAGKMDALVDELREMPGRSVAQHCLLAELYEQTGAHDKADETLTKADAAADGASLLRMQALRLARRRRDWPEAIRIARELLAAHPDKRVFFVRRLVDFCISARQQEDALRWLAEWQRITPASPVPYMREASVHSDAGHSAKAIKVLRRALRISPDNTDLNTTLARYYTEGGALEDAERIYWRLIDAADTLEARLRYVDQLGRIADMRGRSDRLLRVFKSQADADRKALFPVLALARLYQSRHNYEERRKYLLRATEIRTDDVSLLHEVARIENEQGDGQRAVATLERAVRIDPTHRSRMKLAEHYLQHGNQDKGIRLLQSILADERTGDDTVERVVGAMIGAEEHYLAGRLLADLCPARPGDYRLAFMRAIVLTEELQYDQAVDAFLLLLRPFDELPRILALKRPRTQNQFRGYYSLMEELFSPECVDLASYSHLSWEMRRHRQRHYYSTSGYYGFGGYGYGYAPVGLPPTVDDLERYVIGHLSLISPELDDERLERLCGRLRERGVAYPDIKLRLAMAEGDAVEWDDLYERYRDDETALQVIAICGGTGGLSGEPLKEIFARFKGVRPALAFAIALMAQHSGSPDPDMLREAVALIRRMESPPRGVGGMLSDYWDIVPEVAEEGLEKELRELVMHLHRHFTQDEAKGSPLFGTVAGLLARDEDPRAFVALLEEELKRAREKKGTPTVRGRHYHYSSRYGRQQGLDSLQRFPPSYAPGVTREVQAVLGRADGWRGDPDALWPLVAGVKDPILRIRLAARCSKEEETSKLVARLITPGSQTDLCTIVHAASWWGSLGKHAEAARVLLRSRYIPMSAQDRTLLDGALAQAVVAIPGKTGRAEFLAAAQQAALRLRRQRASRAERIQLAGLLEELGLKKASKEVDESISTARVASPFSGRSSYSASPQPIRNALSEGEDEKAVKLAVRQLHAMALPVRLTQSRQSDVSSEIRRVTKLFADEGLLPTLLRALRPGENNDSLRQEMAYATTLASLGDVYEDEARARFEAIIERQSTATGARLQLALLLLEDDAEASREHFSQALEQAPMVALEAVMAHARSHYSIEERLRYVPLVVESVKAAIDTRGANWYTLDRFLDGLTESTRTADGDPISELFKQPEEEEASEEQKAMTERRIEAFGQVADAAMEIPELATSVFQKKLRLARAHALPMDEFPELARQAIRSQGARGGRGGSSSSYVRHYRYYGGREREPVETPVAFLAGHHFETDTLDALDTFIGTLSQPRLKSIREQLARRVELYRAPPDAFLDVALKQVEAAGRSLQRDPGVLSRAIEILQKSKKQADLTPLVLDTARKTFSAGSTRYSGEEGLPPFAGKWCSILAEQGATNRVEAFLDELAHAALGDLRERQGDDIKENSRDATRLSRYVKCLAQFAVHGELVVPVLEHLARLPVLAGKAELCHDIYEVIGEQSRRWSYFSKLPVSGEWDTFRPMLAPDRMSGSLLSSVLGGVQWSHGSGEVTEEMLEAIEENKKQKLTFGQGLAFIFTKMPSARECFEYLGKYADVIAAADESVREEFFLSLHDALSHVGQAGKRLRVGKPAERVHAMYRSVTRGVVEKRVSEFLVDDDFEDADQLVTDTAEFMSMILESSPEEGMRVYDHALELLRKNKRRALRDLSGGSPALDDLETYVVAELAGEVDSLPGIHFVTSRMLVLTNGVGAAPDDFEHELDNLLEHHVDREQDKDEALAAARKAAASNAPPEEASAPQEAPPSNRPPARVRGFLAFADELVTTFGDTPSPPLGALIEGTLLGLSTAHVQHVRETLAAHPHQTSPAGREMLAWVDCWIASPMKTARRKCPNCGGYHGGRGPDIGLIDDGRIRYKAPTMAPGEPTPHLKELYTGIVSNEELPKAWRLNAYCSLLDRNAGYALISALWRPVSPLLLSLSARHKQGLLSGGEEFSRALVLALNADTNEDGTWRETAEEICRLWRRHRLIGASSSPYHSYSRYSHQKRPPAMDLEWAELHARLDRIDDVRRIVTHENSQLRSYPPTYALLVRYNMTNEIPGYLKTRARSMSFSGSYPNRHGMRPGERTVASKVVAGIEDPDLRFVAECLFATVPDYDPKQFAWRGVKSSESLVQERAAALRGLTFTDVRLRDQAFAALLRGPGIEALSAEAMALFAGSETLSSTRSSMFRRYLEHMLAAGRKDIYLGLHKALADAARDGAGDGRKDMIKDMGYKLRSYLCAGRPGGEETWSLSTRDYLALCTEMVAGATPETKHYRGLFALRYFLHHILGEEKAVDGWLAKWRELDPGFKHSSLTPWLMSSLYTNAARKEDGEARAALAKRFRDLCTSELIKEIVSKRYHDRVSDELEDFEEAVEKMKPGAKKKGDA